jgi:hypothetical protein
MISILEHEILNFMGICEALASIPDHVKRAAVASRGEQFLLLTRVFATTASGSTITREDLGMVQR